MLTTTKIVAIRHDFCAQNVPKVFLWPGLCPHPTRSAPPDHLAEFGEPLRDTEGEDWEREGR